MTALYNKYRPHLMKDVVGQDQVKRYFEFAAAKDKISHAYLFSGPRGVGKTTIARIVSLIVNCEDGPRLDYDIKSPLCSSIIESNAAGDIIELDAATHSSIDNIREIRSTAMNYPVMCKKRVFIIDEVHCLRAAAASALLKILEEPPESSMFIMATTEGHRIMPTIRSRCQKFDLKTIGTKTIAKYLRIIAKKEGIVDCEEDALMAVAKASRGSIRDALSILEPIINRSDGTSIDIELVNESIGLSLGHGFFCDVLVAMLRKSYLDALRLIKGIINRGRTPESVLEDLLESSYTMMLYKSLGKTLYVEEPSKEKWTKIQEKIGIDLIIHITKKLSACSNEIRNSNRTDILLDSCIIEIIRDIEQDKYK